MTASALNPAAIAPNAAAGVGPSVAGAPGAAAGFDALLAQLFPQAANLPAPVSAAAQETAAAPMAAPLLAASAETEDTAPAEGETTEVATPDAATLLAAAAVTPQPPAAAPAAATNAADAAHTPPAWGRDKAKGAPAQPALQHASPNARLAEKAALTPEGDGEAEPQPAEDGPPRTAAGTPNASARAAQQAAPASAASAGTPPAPPPALSADPVVGAAPQPQPAAETAAPESAAPTVQAQALAAGQPAARTEAPVSSARPTRAERGKAASETARDPELKPLAAADKPETAKAAGAAAKSAAASVDAAAPELAEAESEATADAPDATPPADTRATTASTAPQAAAAHAVRGSPETVAHLAAQIVKKLEGQSTRFDLELNPQGLGKVDVRVEIGAAGQLTAAMVFDNPQAAQELKARAAELQRALEQAGFDLSGGLKFDVASDQGRQQGQAWQDHGDTGRAFRGQAFRAALETAGEADAAAQGPLRLRRGVNAGLDVRI